MAPWVPSPERPRSFGLLKILSARNDVVAVVLTWGDDDDEAARRLEQLFPIRVFTVRAGRRGGVLRALRAVPSRRSLQQAYVDVPEFRRVVAARAVEHDPDVAYFNVLRSAQLFDAVTAEAAVMDLDEIRSDYYRQLARDSRNWTWRAIAAAESRRMRRAEEHIFSAFTRVLVSSPVELSTGRPQVALVRSPHALTGGKREPRPPLGRRPGPPTVLFVGRLSYRANVEALQWFVRSVLPDLRDRTPDVRLLVVGRGAGRSVRELAGGAVELVGAVEDVTPYYRSADVAITPIYVGTGVQMKLIESLAVGAPAVVSDAAASRAGITGGEARVVAKDTGAWVEAIAGLLEDVVGAEELGRRGQRWAMDNYSPRAIESQFSSALDELGL